MLRQQHPVARVLRKRPIKQEMSITQLENKQKDKTLKLGDDRKLSNADNRDIDATMKNNCHASSCKNVHDTVIEIVQAA